MPKKHGPEEERSGEKRILRLVKTPGSPSNLPTKGADRRPQQAPLSERDLEVTIPVGRAVFDYVRHDKGGVRSNALQEAFVRVNIPEDADMDTASDKVRRLTRGLLEDAKAGVREDLKEYKVTTHTYAGSKFYVIRMRPEIVRESHSGPARVALVHVDMSGRGYALYTTTAAFKDAGLTRAQHPEALRAAMGKPGPSRRGRK